MISMKVFSPFCLSNLHETVKIKQIYNFRHSFDGQWMRTRNKVLLIQFKFEFLTNLRTLNDITDYWLESSLNKFSVKENTVGEMCKL